MASKKNKAQNIELIIKENMVGHIIQNIINISLIIKRKITQEGMLTNKVVND